MELGYPNKKDELLEKYKEDSIYPYVPIDVTEEVIEKHGGIIWND